MTSDPEETLSEQVVLVAPTRRDGEVTRTLLQRADIECLVSMDPDEVGRLIRGGIGALILTDITLSQSGSARFLDAARDQPGWSDIPVLVLCHQGYQSPAMSAALQHIHNVTVLDRPTSARAMVSAVKAALRGRRWQYRIRDQIAALMKAESALRMADQRKNEFLATLAHELRNPLAPIKTGLQLLGRDEIDRHQFATLREMMARQLAQMVRLIDDLLDVSRISTGKMVLLRERVDLRDVVRTAIESCQPMLAAAAHRLSVDVPEQEVMVKGDATRLAQSISNLINNAAKYTPNGGHVRVRLAADDGDAVLTVQDNGVGIPADMLHLVFDLFAQVNRNLERAQGGLGIGLSLVKSLICLHGGQVVADSAGTDQGSTFTIRLPLLAQGDAQAEPAADRLPPPAANDRTVQPLRVMVVDDNRDAADSLAMLLKSVGHQTDIEYDAHAALHKARTFMPAVIFCDVGMPGMDGLQFASALRRDDRFGATLLVAVTGWGTAEDRRRSADAGFDFHLTKPASVESIESILSLR